MNHTGSRYEATTVYDEEAYNALAYLMIHRLRKWPRFLLLVTGFVSVIGSAAMMIAQGRVTAIGAIVLLVGNLMCMFGFLAQRFAVRLMMASSKKGTMPRNDYSFTDESLWIRSGEQEREYSYAYIQRVMEMSGYLFLFLKDGQVYLLRKKGVKGDQKAFMRFLEEKLQESRSTKG